MTEALVLANVLLGIAYCGYGVMTAVEMKRDWKAFGFSHFGAAWICMAFTCGPHHLVHGLHLWSGTVQPGTFDLVAVTFGLPVGVWWLYLRLEAFFSGRGDRYIAGTPWWLVLMPVLAAGYALALASQWGAITHGHFRVDGLIAANAILVVLYSAIGWVVLRTQLANRPAMGGWSVSGLCLSAIFPSCAMMHAVMALYEMGGQYHEDIHGLVIDWLSVPAGMYFLWVVRRLYRDTLSDWNEGPVGVAS